MFCVLFIYLLNTNVRVRGILNLKQNILKINYYKSSLLSIFTVTLSNTLQKFIAFLIPILLIHLIGETEFGKFGFIFNSISVVSSCFIIPFSASVSRFMSKTTSTMHNGNIFNELVVKVFFINVFLVVLYMAFVVFNPLNIKAISQLRSQHLIGSVYIFFILLVSFYNGLLLLYKNYKLYNVSLIIAVSAQFLLVFILAYYYGITGVIISFGIYNVLHFFIIHNNLDFAYRLNFFKRLRPLKKSITSNKVILSFILPNSISFAIMLITLWWANVKLIIIMGSKEVGFITILMQLQIAISFVPNILNTILLPKLSVLCHTNRSLFFSRIVKYFTFVTFIAVGGSVLLYFFAEPILSVYSKEYASYYMILQYFTLSYVLNILISLINQIILSSDNIWWTIILNLSWAIPFVFLLPTEITKDGLKGFAFTYNIAFLVQFAVALMYLALYFKKNKNQVLLTLKDE